MLRTDGRSTTGRWRRVVLVVLVVAAVVVVVFEPSEQAPHAWMSALVRHGVL